MTGNKVCGALLLVVGDTTVDERTYFLSLRILVSGIVRNLFLR